MCTQIKTLSNRGLTVALLVVAVIALGWEATRAADPPAGDTPGLVRQIKVLPDKAPDCSTLKAIVDSITRECKTNDEKMIAVNNFMRIATYHRAIPGRRP